MAYLLMPFWQGIIGLGLVGALLLAILGSAPFWGAGPTWQLVFFYLLAFGGTPSAASPRAPGKARSAGCAAS